MQVKFTKQAQDELDKIADYYSTNANEDVAERLVVGIVAKATALQRFPNLGVLDPNLVNARFTYKYVVYKKFKIIFRKTKNVIYINDIFDARQDPQKLVERNK